MNNKSLLYKVKNKFGLSFLYTVLYFERCVSLCFSSVSRIVTPTVRGFHKSIYQKNSARHGVNSAILCVPKKFNLQRVPFSLFLY